MLRRSQTAVSLLLLSSLAPAFAQDNTTPAPAATTEQSKEEKTKKATEKKTEKIQVTGSRIRQLDLEGPKPVITVDRKDLEKSGAVNLNEALNKMSIASFGSFEYGSNYGVPEGSQTIDLRGLGEGNTLILINGRRIVRDPSLEFVDLSIIPTAAVERVEIITGTASAVYGSDALSGVINIITRQQYEGTSFGYSKTKPRQPGGDRDQMYVMAGTNSERSSNLITLQWDQSTEILAKDRYFNDTSFRSGRGTPISYQTTTKAFAPVGPCTMGSKGNGFCGYDYWDKQYQAQGNWQKVSVLDDFSYQITDSTKFNLRVFGTQKTANSRSLPGVLDNAADGYTVSRDAINEFHPELITGAATDPLFGADDGVLVHGRLPAAVSGTKSQQTTFSAGTGVSHRFSNDSELEFNVNDSRTTRTHLWTNMLDDNKFRQAVYTGEYDVLSLEPTGDISLYELDVPDTFASTSRSFELNYNGSFELAGKTAGYSIGASHIRESYLNHASANKLNEQIKGLGGGGGEGSRKANAVYAELGVPIVSSLEANVAARFDDYTDFGSTVNPMVGLQYRFNKEFFVRVNGGTGFKAPTLRELHDDEARYYDSFTDYKLCNVATEAQNAGNITKYCKGDRSAILRQGGNTELDPQKSTSASFFFGYEPVVGTGLTLEYWNQQIKDVIKTVTSDELMTMEADGRALPVGTAINRDPVTGDVVEIVSPTTNLSTVKASGLTVNAYSSVPTSFGTFSYKTDYSYFLSYTQQKLPGGKFEQYLEEGGQPRWRWSNTFGYGIANNEIRLTSNSNARFQKGNKFYGFVGSYTNWDLNYSYVVNKTFDFELGGTNIFQQGYPKDDTDAISQGLPNSFYPLIGPTYFGRLNFHI